MALRHPVKPLAGAGLFAHGLYDFLHGTGEMEQRFTRWCEVGGGASPAPDAGSDLAGRYRLRFHCRTGDSHFLKPTVTLRAAEALGLPFDYRSRPNWEAYAELLRLSRAVRKDLRDLHPRDVIDIQSFLWVQASDEYPDR